MNRKMSRHGANRFASLILISFMLHAGVATAQAGAGGGDGGIAFAGGQMVRGTVTAGASDRLSVRTDAGEAWQIAVSANTRVMKERQPFKLADVKSGDTVAAMGVLDAPTKTIHAVFVSVVDAEQVKKMKEGLGKVYITGKVTAIEDVKLTILRPDGVSQVIEVDEGTSFKRGGRGMMSMLNGSGPVGAEGPRPPDAGAGRQGSPGESITLADVKTGDIVVGPGALKNNVFVPAELGVMNAAAMAPSRRRRTLDGSAPGTGATSPGAPPAEPAAPPQ